MKIKFAGTGYNQTYIWPLLKVKPIVMVEDGVEINGMQIQIMTQHKGHNWEIMRRVFNDFGLELKRDDHENNIWFVDMPFHIWFSRVIELYA